MNFCIIFKLHSKVDILVCFNWKRNQYLLWILSTFHIAPVKECAYCFCNMLLTWATFFLSCYHHFFLICGQKLCLYTQTSPKFLLWTLSCTASHTMKLKWSRKTKDKSHDRSRRRLCMLLLQRCWTLSEFSRKKVDVGVDVSSMLPSSINYLR